MATKYLWSGAAGAGTGADWTNAYTTMTAAIAGTVANDILLIAHDHVEALGANTSYAFVGAFYLCVNRTTGLPAETASISTTGQLTLAAGIPAVFYGIIFASGSASSVALAVGATGGVQFMMERCTLKLTSANGAARLVLSSNSSSNIRHTFRECSFSFAQAGQRISGSSTGVVEIYNDQAPFFAAGSAALTTVFDTNARLRVQGVDFTPAAAAAVILGSYANPLGYGLFTDCKLGASQVFMTATPSGRTVDAVNCVNGITNGPVNRRRHHVYGVLTTEATIVRTAGASTGLDSYSWKLVSNASAGLFKPMECPEGFIWNDTVGSPVTLTIEIATDGVTLTENDIGLEVDYPKTAASPLCGMATTYPNFATRVIGSPANLPASVVGWTTTGLASPVKQKLSVTFTPQEEGPIRWRVNLTKASATVYVDPKPELT